MQSRTVLGRVLASPVRLRNALCGFTLQPDLWRNVRTPLGARIAPVRSASVGGCFIDAIRSSLDGVSKPIEVFGQFLEEFFSETQEDFHSKRSSLDSGCSLV